MINKVYYTYKHTPNTELYTFMNLQSSLRLEIIGEIIEGIQNDSPS